MEKYDRQLGWGIAYITRLIERYGFDVVAGPYGGYRNKYNEFRRRFANEEEALEFLRTADFERLCRKEQKAPE